MKKTLGLSLASMATSVVLLLPMGPAAGQAGATPGAGSVSMPPDLTGVVSKEQPDLTEVIPGLERDGLLREPLLGEAGVESEVERLEALPEAPTRPLPTTYRKSSYTPVQLSPKALPYNEPTVRGWKTPGERDPSGVRMVRVDGKLYDHPVAQAQDALAALSDYRLTKESRYLKRAQLSAQRLVDNRVESDGAWYYPYPFDFSLHGNSRDRLKAPWFSSMAQGQALSLFVRLHQTTGDVKWRAAADATFASFLNAPVKDRPSTVHIDADGYLWLEEYPFWPPSSSDRTLNGHVFAIFGLYDYQQLTKDKRAASLWNGGLAMVRHYMGRFRNPGWISHYCLAHPAVQSLSYHQVHQQQTLLLHAMTKDSWWSRTADSLRNDYPWPLASGTVRFVAGTHTAYRFSQSGAILAKKSVRLTRSSNAPADRRERIKGRGVYYRITAGVFAGYHVAESPTKSRLLGIHLMTRYPWARTATLPAGRSTAYKYSSTGAVRATRSISLSRQSNAPFDASAVINGRLHVRITAGALAGYWLPTTGVILR